MAGPCWDLSSRPAEHPVEDMDEAEMEALRTEALVRMTKKMTKKVGDLTRLWWDIGVSGSAFKNRLARTEDHVDRLFNEMYEGEEDMRQRMVASNEQLSTQVRELSEQLGLPLTLPDSGLTVLEQDSVLRTKAAELNLIKAQRKKERRRLLTEEAELRAKLDAAPFVLLWRTPIPSEDELQQLGRHIAALTEEKIKRQAKFSSLRKEIVAMLERLDVRPESEIEQDIVLKDPSAFLLSSSNMKAAEDYLQQLKDLEAERRREHASLVEQLALYWERLDTPKSERENFQRSHLGLTAATLNALKQQIAECEVLKRQRIREFITRVQDELLTWYSTCCVPKRKAQLEEDWDSEEWSEERLERLERELKILKDFHAENKDIFSKVERREVLWARLLDFEKRTADPARLNNRGGRLLSEMKERKRLETELPRLEKEITSYIQNYAGNKMEVFQVWSAEFLAHLEAQHAAYNEEKERERLERERRRQKGPATPARTGAKRLGQGTPSCSASKMSRLGMSSGASTTARMTPSSKASILQRTATPSRSTPLKPKRRSLRKKAVARKLGTSNIQAPGAGAPSPANKAPRSVTAKDTKAAPESSFCSFEGFTRGLCQQPVDKHLTSSVLVPATPTTGQAAAAKAAAAVSADTTDTTLCAANGEQQATPVGS